jgi:hypothetical protein
MSPMVTAQNILAPGQNSTKVISGWASGMTKGHCSMKMGIQCIRVFGLRICIMGKGSSIMTMGMFNMKVCLGMGRNFSKGQVW